MKTLADFEQEIKALDSRFSVSVNLRRGATEGNVCGLANIFFEGKNYDLPVLPDGEIKDVEDPLYFYTFPHGGSARFWSRPEVLARLQKFLIDFKNGVYDGL